MKSFLCLSLAALLVGVATAAETRQEDQTLSSSSSSDMVHDMVLMLVQAARSTSYSSLLTLNVTNVIVLAFVAFIALGYFGFIDVGLGLGRSLGGSSFDMSSVSSAVASVAPIVYQAIEAYSNLQEEDAARS